MNANTNTSNAGHLAYLAERAATQCAECHEHRCARDSAELARMVLVERSASPRITRIAAATARRVVLAMPGTEAAEAAADVLTETEPHAVLAHAAYMVAALPQGTCDHLARALDRAGYMGPYRGERGAYVL